MFKKAIKKITDMPIGTLYIKPISQQYSTKSTCQFKGKAAKDLANDDTGKHTHVIEEKCLFLCDKPNDFAVKGHNTHRPPIGCLTRFVSEEDANGHKKSQYFVLSNTKKEVTEQEHQQYGKDIKQQTFVTQHPDK